MTDIAPPPIQLPNPPQTTAHVSSRPGDDMLKFAVVTVGIVGAGLIGLLYLNGGRFQLAANGTSASLEVGRRHPTREGDRAGEFEQQDDDNPKI